MTIGSEMSGIEVGYGKLPTAKTKRRKEVRKCDDVSAGHSEKQVGLAQAGGRVRFSKARLAIGYRRARWMSSQRWLQPRSDDVAKLVRIWPS